MTMPAPTRGLQLEAAVDRLPDWYFDPAARYGADPTIREVDELYFGPSTAARRQYDDLEFGRRDDQGIAIHSALGRVAEERTGQPTSPKATLANAEAFSQTTLANGSAFATQLAANAEAALLASLTLDLLARRTSLGSVDSNGRTVASNNQDHAKMDRRPESEPATAPTSVETDDGLKPAATLTRSTSSRRSTASSGGAYSDLRVSGFSMRAREKSVMYHIDVLHSESQLQTYTIRRSYSDFKDLHSQLSEILDARQQYYRSRALSRQSQSQTRRSTLTGESNQNETEEEAVERAVMAFSLPALPHAGLLSFWKRHDRAHLQSRCQSFQELLHAVLSQPFLREAFAMQAFLSVAPCTIRERGSSYVSLSEYGVPRLDRDEEHRERRRRAQQYRRNSSASANAATLVEF